ncbi:threonine--tRNA ligase [Delftia acidovorans]|uniref:Threonine--tRNA ligase n=1 Tax=Delftia acidovorans TaxID=80866 RepID=A0A7T2VZV4_DELAC|nr:threonine--tRNA ligase [Delftia acidovorans]QPS08548.1 threonine--tRNA ligase [Delftia acidovorans]
MIHITLPDGSQREYPGPVTVAEVVASIGTGLAKAALAGKVGAGEDAKVVDTSFVIDKDMPLSIVTAKDADGLDVIRHSTAHLLAYAVKELFPEAQVTIGPVIENGFYYDFSYKRPFTPEDLVAIEKRMAELAAKDEPVVRRVLPRDEAVAYFKGIGENYKAEIIASIPSNEDVSLYREGSFEDLCRGPHVPSTGKLKFFKLMKVAGAYWRGDHRNEMLQRVYGTAWASKDDLQQYLHMLEEAEKRDHRKLGRELDLFHIDEHSPGTVFWHPKGWSLWQEVEQYMRRVYRDNGYQEVKGPQILDKTLWEKTGHWDKYRENMFTTESEKRDYALKPMNCPGHILIFKQGIKSYRDLPLRYGEFGQCHRNEPTGGLHGIMRVRGFTQDDGHVFCTEDQIQPEVLAFTTLLQKVYADFGFSDIIYKVATRPEARIGSDESWDKAEAALINSLEASGCEYVISPGDGAFYGPKIEYTLKDAIGRQWQCGTIQVDFSMPERLDAEYVGEDGDRHRPVMLHRAIVGSLERFIGILIEQHAGAMPTWLAPVQAAVLNITDAQADYVREVAQKLQKAFPNQGLRVATDLRNEKITYKIREHSLQKLPYILVAGDKEKAAGAVAVRARGNKDLGVMSVDAFIELVAKDIAAKA